MFKAEKLRALFCYTLMLTMRPRDTVTVLNGKEAKDAFSDA